MSPQSAEDLLAGILALGCVDSYGQYLLIKGQNGLTHAEMRQAFLSGWTRTRNRVVCAFDDLNAARTWAYAPQAAERRLLLIRAAMGR